MSKRIGIVIGGGGCPGLNAVIRSVAKAAAQGEWETIGIIGGYDGLLPPGNYRRLDYQALDGLLVRGGTILGTANRGQFTAKVGHGESRGLPTELLDNVKLGMSDLGLSTCSTSANSALAISSGPLWIECWPKLFATRGRIKVVFLPNYNVSLAERLIPASDASEQISTAGYEASGTGNMKFMLNGALTVGTRDGATIEMAEEAGEENFFLFGLTADEVQNSRGWYSPLWHYENDPETRDALDLIFNDHFSRDMPGIFAPIRETLLDRGDYYMHLADLTSYAQAQQRLGELYSDPDAWARKAIINVACSGKFSSDRTITEYAAEIWNATPCPLGLFT